MENGKAERRGYPNPDYKAEDADTWPFYDADDPRGRFPPESNCREPSENETLGMAAWIGDKVLVPRTEYAELIRKAAAMDLLTQCITETGKAEEIVVRAVTGTAKVYMENEASAFRQLWFDEHGRRERAEAEIKRLQNALKDLDGDPAPENRGDKNES